MNPLTRQSCLVPRAQRSPTLPRVQLVPRKYPSHLAPLGILLQLFIFQLSAPSSRVLRALLGSTHRLARTPRHIQRANYRRPPAPLSPTPPRAPPRTASPRSCLALRARASTTHLLDLKPSHTQPPALLRGVTSTHRQALPRLQTHHNSPAHHLPAGHTHLQTPQHQQKAILLLPCQVPRIHLSSLYLLVGVAHTHLPGSQPRRPMPLPTHRSFPCRLAEASRTHHRESQTRRLIPSLIHLSSLSLPAEASHTFLQDSQPPRLTPPRSCQRPPIATSIRHRAFQGRLNLQSCLISRPRASLTRPLRSLAHPQSTPAAPALIALIHHPVARKSQSFQ